jgi:hypothetical protein
LTAVLSMNVMAEPRIASTNTHATFTHARFRSP